MTSYPALSVVSETNFTETVFTSVPGSVTGMAWAPDGSNRLFITHQDGVIRLVENKVLRSTSFASLSVKSGGESGLLGICFDPNYVINRYVYFFVTTGSDQRILRLTDNNGIGTNQITLISGLPGGGGHNGGAIGFGFDGKLYWAIGDGGGSPTNLATLGGKVGRANADGSYALDNPFVDGPGPNKDFIWALGLRNPFTFTFHPFTGDLWVNSVGGSYEQVFLMRRGDHAGYFSYSAGYENNPPPGCIAPKIKYRTGLQGGTDTISISSGFRSNSIATFVTASPHGFRQGEKLTIFGTSGWKFNGVFYIESTPSTTTFTIKQSGPVGSSTGGTAQTQSIGGCITGGCFYDGTGFPPVYRTNFFFCDYNSGRVMRAIVNTNNEVKSVDYFANGISQAIDTSVGPDGALYYVKQAGTIYRVAYDYDQGLIVQPTGLSMAENGEAVFTVSLSQPPASNQVVKIVRNSGDADIDAVNTVLIFNPTNYAIPQIVKLRAQTDTDFENDRTQFTVSSIGFYNVSVFVNAFDTQGVPSLLSVSQSNGNSQIHLMTGPGRSNVLEVTTNLVEWNAVGTNISLSNHILFLDSSTQNVPFRFYRAFTK